MLIGTWDYRHLAPVPAAQHSLHRMRSLLTSPLCGSWPEDQVAVVDNRAKSGDLPHELVLWLRNAVDVALFYYVGHGQYDNDDRLCLALGDSSPDPVLRTTTSLTFDAVRLAFRASKAATKIAILDCCFAGLAAGHDSRLAGTHDIPRSPGFYLMMASGEFNTAWFETSAESPRPQTYFTKYLVDLIERGIPDHPAGLTLGPIFDKVADALVRDGKPAPGCRVSDHAAAFVFARNRANPEVLEAAPDLSGAVFNAAPAPLNAQISKSPVSESRGGNPAAVGSLMNAPPGGMSADEMYSTAYALETDWDGTGLKNLVEMERLYRAAAKLGQTDAMGRLGLLLEGKTRATLEGGNYPAEPLDVDEAMYWYKESAQRGNIFGAYWLGLLYEDRLGNSSEALKWYEVAAHGGHQGAQTAQDGLRERLALGLGPLAGARRFEGEPSRTPQSQPKNRKVGMTNERAKEQGAIIAKMVSRVATESEVARLNANYDRWEKEWQSPYFAFAACTDELAKACGDSRGEWGTLTEEEQSALVRYFSLAYLPTESGIKDDARNFRDEIRSLGGTLRDYARRCMHVFGIS
ncbi:caspase, EACC1-associated type [Streptomyces sp. NPDC054783]